MAFTRKFLAAFGIEADKVDEIINAHVEVVDALKAERDHYKEDAERLPKVEAELKELKDAAEKAGKDGDTYQVKYEAMKEKYESYKADVEAKQTRATKETAYRELLKEAKVSDKRVDSIIKVSGDTIDKLELDKDGKIKNSSDLLKSITSEWADFIVTETKTGASTSTPPTNNGGSKMSKDDIMAIKDTAQRQKAMLENKELFLQ